MRLRLSLDAQRVKILLPTVLFQQGKLLLNFDSGLKVASCLIAFCLTLRLLMSYIYIYIYIYMTLVA